MPELLGDKHVSFRSSKVIAAVAMAAVATLTLAGCTQPIEVAIPDALTEPGTEFALGETARVEGSAYQKEPRQLTQEVEVGVTVTSITKQDASFYDQMSNGDDFADYTPYTVIIQTNLPKESEKTYDSPQAPGVWGVLSNGEFAEYLDVDGFGSTSELCGDGAGTSTTIAAIDCQVFLAPAGETLTHVEWNGEMLGGSMGIDLGEESPYIADPLVWK